MKKLLIFLVLTCFPFVAEAQAQWSHKTLPLTSAVGAGITTTFSVNGLAPDSLASDSLCTITIPANAWADGGILSLHIIFEDSTNGAGTAWLRSQFNISGCAPWVWDSSSSIASLRMPLVFTFTRFGDSILMTPDIGLHSVGTTHPLAELIGNGSKAGLSAMYQDAYTYKAGYTNGASRYGADFTKTITISFFAEWFENPGTTAVVKCLSAGTQYIALQ